MCTVGTFFLLLGTIHGVTIKNDLPKFVGPPSNVTVAVGREAVLTCIVDNLQSFKVAWLRVDTQTILSIATHVITKNHRVSVSHGDSQTWTLTLREVVPTDGGRYMCQVNTEPMTSQLHHLQVVVPPDILETGSSSDVTVSEGETASLRCTATGTPTPVITWRREDSKHITIDTKTSASKWTGEYLNISAVEKTASGAYLCIASNGVPPTVSKRIILHVQFAPLIWPHQKIMSGYEGEKATLQCSCDSSPKPYIYWTKGENPTILAGNKYQTNVITRGYRYSGFLYVSNITLEDFGSYQCHCRNSIGISKANLTFIVNILTTTTTTSTTTTTTTTTTPSPATTSRMTTIEIATEPEAVEWLPETKRSHDEDTIVVVSRHRAQNIEAVSTR